MDMVEPSISPEFLQNNVMDVEDEMPVPKEEIVDIKPDEPDLEIIEVHCNINPKRVNTFKRRVPIKIQRQNRDNQLSKKNSNLNITEEIVISDSSDAEYDSSVKKPSKPSYSTRRSKESSLSSIILNCPKCNRTKTVFSTTLTSECKECKENMSFVCNECNLKFDSLTALFRHKKLQCKKHLSSSVQFVHKCTKCEVKYKITNFRKSRNCLKCNKIMAFECLICAKPQTSVAVIYKHTRDQCQSTSRTYYCNDCSYKNTSQRQLLLHFSSCHQDLYMLNTTCDRCCKGFANYLTLEQHKNICGIPYHFCKFCPYRPRLRLSLKRHLSMVHKVPKDEIDKILDSSACPESYKKDSVVDKSGKSCDFILKELSQVTCTECNVTQPVMKHKNSVQDYIKVSEKPVQITQKCSTKCDPNPAGKQIKKRKRKRQLKFSHVKRSRKPQSEKSTKQTELSTRKEVDKQTNTSETIIDNNNQTNLQIENVSKAECLFIPENDDSVSMTDLVNEETEASDPLQDCDLERSERVKEKTVREIIIISNKQKDLTYPESLTKTFMPYIRKLCENCQKVSELIADPLSNKRCHLCKKSVTYCCKLCLEVTSLQRMYTHIFKSHYNNAMGGVVTITAMKSNNAKCFVTCNQCAMRYTNAQSLREHEKNCNLSTNLFCAFCPSKLRTKREMREHIVQEHSKKFKMSSLEKLLDNIVKEGDAVISMLTQLNGYCNNCKKQVPLTQPSRRLTTRCFTCSTNLVYYCNDTDCKPNAFTEVASLQAHLRSHANRSWSRKKLPNTRTCHLCGYQEEPAKVKIHMTTKHPEIFLCKCDACGVSLKNVKAWKRHQANYCPATHQKLQCGHCWFRCFKKNRLQKHLKNVHTHLYTGKRPECNKCGITWAGLYRLRWHETKCSGDSDFERAKQKELWAMRGVVPLS